MKTRRSSARSIPFARCSFIRAGVACSDSRGSTTIPPSCRGKSTSTASRAAFRPSILRSASSASTRFRRARRCRPSSTSMEPACVFHSRASWSWRVRTTASAGRSRVAACGSPSATSPGGTCPRSMTGASSSTFPRPCCQCRSMSSRDTVSPSPAALPGSRPALQRPCRPGRGHASTSPRRSISWCWRAMASWNPFVRRSPLRRPRRSSCSAP